MLLSADVVLLLVPVVQIAEHLESLLRQPGTPQSALDDAHLLASALLAVEPQGYAGSPQGQRLLKALASAPLQRMAPATMKLAIFSWGWVSCYGRVPV